MSALVPMMKTATLIEEYRLAKETPRRYDYEISRKKYRLRNLCRMEAVCATPTTYTEEETSSVNEEGRRRLRPPMTGQPRRLSPMKTATAPSPITTLWDGK